jgi:hypothetical protein
MSSPGPTTTDTAMQIQDEFTSEESFAIHSNTVVVGPQCQHVEDGRCDRCADPMNPKHYNKNPAWFSVKTPFGGKLFGNVQQNSRTRLNAEFQFHKLIKTLNKGKNHEVRRAG